MSSERIGIYLDLVGDESIDELRAKLLELENKKIRIRVEADKQLSDIDSKIRRITNRKNEIKFRYDKKLGEFNDQLEKLRQKRIKLNIDYAEAEKAISKLGAGAQKIQQAFQKKWGVDANLDGYLKKLGQINGQIGVMNDRVKQTKSHLAKSLAPYNKELANLRSRKAEIQEKVKLDTSAVNQQMSEIRQRIKAQQLEARVNLKPDYGKFFRNVQSQMSRVGSTFMTLGNAMQRITSPINSVMRGFAYGVGYQALNKVTEGLKSGFSRYDTMKKYPLMMQQFAKASYSAEQSVHDLDMSVRGLPTGLDQIVDLAQRFTLSLGDMERGTKLAIATNRAFLASMATETQQYQGMMQMQDLMNGKKLNSREWMSLGASMGYAINEIGKVLGYDDAGKFRQALYGNQIATEDFLKALEKVGNKGGKVYKQAEYAKATWQAVAANIGNAFSRLTYNALKSLDEIFQAGTGKTFVQWTDQIRDGIDNISESISGWVKANPDKIMDFFNTIKSYDWVGLGKGIAQGFGEVFSLLKGIGDFLLGDSGGAKLGRAMVKINMWGKIISLFGGILKGLSFPVAGIATLGKWLTGIGGLGRLLKVGLFAKLAGKAGTVVKGMKGAEKIATVSATTMTKWGALAKFGTATQIAAGGLAIKQVLEGIAEISKVDIPDNIGEILGKATVAIGGLTTLATFAGRALAASPWAVLGGAVGGGIAWLVGDAIANVFESIKSLAEGLHLLHDLKPVDKGHFKTVVDSIKGVAPDLKTLYGELKEIFPKDKGKPFAEYSKGEGTIADEVEGIKKALENVVGVNSAINEVSKIKIDEKKIEAAKESISKIGEVIEGLKQDIASIFGEETYYADRGQSRGGKKTGKWSRGKYDSSSLEQYSEATGYFQEALTNLTGIVTAVADFQTEFDRVAGDLFTKGKDGYDSSAIQEKIEGIRTFLNSAFTTNGIGQAMKGATESLKDVDTTAIAGAFNGLIGIITEMHNVQTKLEELSMGESAFDIEGLNAKLGQLGMAIGNLGTSLAGAKFNEESLFTLDNIQRAFVKIKAVADQITSMGIDGALSSIQDAINKIKGVDWSGMKIPPIDIQVQINLRPMPIDTSPVLTATTAAIGAVRASILGMTANIDKTVKVKLKPSISGQDGVVSAVRSAIDDVKGRISRIPSSVSKTINVQITRNVSTGGDPIPHGPGFSTGGYVGGTRPLYRAGGGSIFKPKGTDTVPAMLTPGEYINKRAVVNKLGVPFFQRLNNLDIPGALRELSIRTGMNLGGGTVINNYNNTTNNTTNNISVPTSDKDSQNFTMRRIGRFAGAL